LRRPARLIGTGAFAKAGFNQSFIKPVRREKLFQILGKY